MTTTFTKPTNHAIYRAKERVQINEKKAERMFSLALERGKTADDFTSWERNYLKSEEHSEHIAIAYAGFCYIFTYQRECITVYPLPTWFGKKKHYNGKERIRNMKAYSRNHFDYSLEA